MVELQVLQAVVDVESKHCSRPSAFHPEVSGFATRGGRLFANGEKPCYLSGLTADPRYRLGTPCGGSDHAYANRTKPNRHPPLRARRGVREPGMGPGGGRGRG